MIRRSAEYEVQRTKYWSLSFRAWRARWVALGCLTVALVGVMPARAFAQGPDAAGPTASQHPWTLAPYFGVSVQSPVGVRWGLTPDRRHFFFGLHATIVIVERPRWSFRYAPEVVPLLVVTNNPRYLVTPIAFGDPDQPAEELKEGILITESGRGPVAGFAVSPIGLEVRSPLSARWQAYASGALGGVWFTRDVPILNARLFNLTAEFGGGLLWRLNPTVSLRAGYKFHHLSNGHTAPENPGIDGHVLVVGFERAFGSH